MEDVRQYYNRIAPHYFERTKFSKSDELYELLTPILQVSENWLDIGVGSGRDLRNLGRIIQNKKAFGTEISEHLAEMAELNTGLRIHLMDVREGDSITRFLQSARVAEQSFAVVTAVASLIHLQDDELRLALRNIQEKLLAPQGTLVSVFKLIGAPGSENPEVFTRFWEMPELEKLYSEFFPVVEVRQVSAVPDQPKCWAAVVASNPGPGLPAT